MNKKSKILVVLALMLCITLVFAGCKKEEPPVDTTPSGPHLVDDTTETTEESTEETVVNDDVTVNADGETANKDDPNHVHNYTVAASTDASCEKAGTVTKQCSCGSTKTETKRKEVWWKAGSQSFCSCGY